MQQVASAVTLIEGFGWVRSLVSWTKSLRWDELACLLSLSLILREYAVYLLTCTSKAIAVGLSQDAIWSELSHVGLEKGLQHSGHLRLM